MKNNSSAQFYCDICGTYLDITHITEIENDKHALKSFLSSPERKKNVANFVDAIGTLANTYGINNIYFAFVSSEEANTIELCMKEIYPYLREYNGTNKNGVRFTLMKSYSDCKTVVPIKNDNIIYFDETQHSVTSRAENIIRHYTHHDSNKLFVADDSTINHTFLQVFFNALKNPGKKMSHYERYIVEHEEYVGFVPKVLNNEDPLVSSTRAINEVSSAINEIHNQNFV